MVAMRTGEASTQGVHVVFAARHTLPLPGKWRPDIFGNYEIHTDVMNLLPGSGCGVYPK